MRVTLPLPPTLSSAYTNLRLRNGAVGRTKTPKYRDWEKIAHKALYEQFGQITITEDKWLKVHYDYFMPIYTKKGDKKKLDVANREKCTSDILEKLIEGFEDHKIKRMTMEKFHSDRNEVEITIEEMDD